MPAKHRNPANFFAKNPTKDIKIVRFLGYDWIVTNSYKSNGSRFYDLAAASYETISGQKLRRVPTGSIRKYPEPGTRDNGDPMTLSDYIIRKPNATVI